MGAWMRACEIEGEEGKELNVSHGVQEKTSGQVETAWKDIRGKHSQ